MEFSWNPNTKCTEKPQSSISMCTLFLVLPLFQKYINSQVKIKKIGKECCLPPLSFKISLRNAYIHISLNLLEFYLSPECLLNFLWLVCSTMCGKIVSIYGVHIPRKCIKSLHFYSCPSPPLKTPGRIFWKSISLKMKRVEETLWRKNGLLYWN